METIVRLPKLLSPVILGGQIPLLRDATQDDAWQGPQCRGRPFVRPV